MKGTLLRFYVHENRKHHHLALFEWLLEQAKKQGIHGGSAFRAIAGFGRHGILHARGELSPVETYAAEIACTGRGRTQGTGRSHDRDPNGSGARLP